MSHAIRLARVKRLEAAMCPPPPIAPNGIPRERRDMAVVVVLRHHFLKHPELLELLLAEDLDNPALDKAQDIFVSCIAHNRPCELCGHDIVDLWIQETGGKLQLGEPYPRPYTSDDFARMLSD